MTLVGNTHFLAMGTAVNREFESTHVSQTIKWPSEPTNLMELTVVITVNTIALVCSYS